MVAQDMMLTHPNFKEGFELHTDVSKLQIGGVILQKQRPLGYFSKKNQAQANYTVTEK